MELFLIILRNTAIVIAGIYVLLLIVTISFVWSFSSILSHHNHDLTVILTNKRDNLLKLSTLLTSGGVKLDKKNLDALNNFDLKRIENQDGEDAKAARDELTSLSEYFLMMATTNESVLNQEEYQLTLENINELEKVYRHHLMMYNADVLGYNFWINFFPTRFIFKMFRLKRKDNI